MEPFATETDEATGLTLKIVADDDLQNPLADDEAIRFAVLHRRYTNPAEAYGLTDQEALEAFERDAAADWAAFPLYLYDHSGVAYRVSETGNPFACPWDSGRVGTVFVDRRAVAADHLLAAAEGAATAYTAYANGWGYGFQVEDAAEDELGACWGFLSQDEALDQGRAVLAAEVRRRAAANDA